MNKNQEMEDKNEPLEFGTFPQIELPWRHHGKP